LTLNANLLDILWFMVDITIFTMENHHFFHGLMNGGSIELVFMV
jgi:hypothetical protein